MAKLVAGLLGLSLLVAALPAGAADCASGADSYAVAVRNDSGADIKASLRDHNSDGGWQSADVAAGADGSTPVCLTMTLGVGSIAYKVADGSGKDVCSGDKLVPQGGTVALDVGDGGACTVKVTQ